MCGIAGILRQPDEALLDKAMSALAHRGPDGRGYWIDAQRRVGLAHTRLSIIDLPGGAQPIFNEDRSVAVVFNGEIYNYVELRRDLIDRGHRFATQTDTEVLVHLYEERRKALLADLRGMFAFAIWDDRHGLLMLARDRVGKKPLYYATIDDRFLFASEIKGLKALGVGPLTIDDQALSDYLTFGHVPAPATIHRQIRALPPASCLIAEPSASPRVETYWRWPAPDQKSTDMPPDGPRTVAEAAEQTDALIDEAVRLRLRADVPVGVFLSGGLDSGLIVAHAAQHSQRPLTTLSVGFENESFDERPLARIVARQYATDHHEWIVRPDPSRILERIASAYDQPYADSSAIPSIAVAERARQQVKVVLNGDGGDEVFAGYRRYVGAAVADRLGRLSPASIPRLARLSDRLLPQSKRHRTRYAFARRLIRGLAMNDPQRILAWGNDGLDEPAKRRLVGDRGDWLNACRPTDLQIETRLAQIPADSTLLDRQLWIDAHTLLPDDLLVKMDIATMAHGLEARSPRLDHRLVETVARWPGRVRLPGSETKPILRHLARKYLPPEIALAPKRGFEVPLTAWLEHDLREVRNDLLLHPTGLMAERFDRRALAELVDRPPALEKTRWARWVWTLMILAAWDRQR